MVSLTKEEKRVSAYFQANQPTDPKSVTQETPLESLNLNWTENDLPERVRTKHVHRLHPYLGKFIPQLVEIFLRKYFKEGDVVLDPFCGSGTTLVQANELGVNSIGYDISAFNTILCKAKTDIYNLQQVKKEIKDILSKMQASTAYLCEAPLQLELLSQSILINNQIQAENDYLSKWFAPQALEELLTYKSLIDLEDYKYKNLLRIILSRSARSARLTTHFDLDFPKEPQIDPYWCYKHSRHCKPTTEAFKFIKRYSSDTVKRILEFSKVRTKAEVAIHHADSRSMEIPEIDGIITSPPYVGLIDYHKQHAYAYNLLGLEDRQSFEIGSASKGSSLKAKRQYQEDIADVFRRAMASLKTGGRIIVVAGDRANLYDEIAVLAGVEVEAVVTRHVNRRTGRRSSDFYESVFIWRKP